MPVSDSAAISIRSAINAWRHQHPNDDFLVSIGYNHVGGCEGWELYYVRLDEVGNPLPAKWPYNDANDHLDLMRRYQVTTSQTHYAPKGNVVGSKTSEVAKDMIQDINAQLKRKASE